VRATRRPAGTKRPSLPCLTRSTCTLTAMKPPVPAITITTRAVQNRQTTTCAEGATSTHQSNGPCPDNTRRTMLPGLMNDGGDVLGRPPATHVAAVITSHGTIQSAMSTTVVPKSCQTLALGRGAAAISVLTMQQAAGRYADKVGMDTAGA